MNTDKLDKIMMIVAFIISGLSAIMWYGNGFHTWCWQIVTMMWIINSYVKTLRINRLEKLS